MQSEEKPEVGDQGKSDSTIGIKMAGLVIVGILGLGAVMVAVILSFVETPDGKAPAWLLVGLGVVGAGTCWASVVGLKRLNNRWKTNYLAKFETEPEALLGSWTVDEIVWKTFATNERAGGRGDAVWVAGIVALFVAIPVFLGGRESLGSPDVYWWSLASGISTFAIVFGVHRWFQSMIFRRRQKFSGARILIRNDGMRINEDLVVWNQFGTRLDSAKIGRPGKDGYAVIEIEVSSPGQRGRIHRKHRIPVPSQLISDGEKVVGRLCPLMRGSR